ncbi:diguanylate cyclase (GGDEF) domain-containing protein [Hoeflea sp. IMCC20628]|uniref:putative bifunctional diguanylate cyclase/phosphodiesterase n=1 Tax=Hoeflea sp. IMCC20628 TaxID=1620421 RepID=UPI00063BF5D3|nr:EAL domain-containing protein [Hoeflea sp. IMCC20628]AKH99598.1 diguanylate cyclase (GGDEF) domain-containing protein [Hoeflea sp. IMCC20628]
MPSQFAFYKSRVDPVRQQALATAYCPIVRGFLLPGMIYYSYITLTHFRDETGLELAILASICFTTVVSYYVMRQHVLASDKLSLQRLELIGLAANLLIYLNVVCYLTIHFEQNKLIYFALMAVVFSTTGITFRGTLLSVGLALVTLYFFASRLPHEILTQYVSIGIATTFASLGMAALLRKAIRRQIDARLLADGLAAKAQRLADTDMLTGVPNRRAVFEKIDYLISQKRPFWIGIFDLDGFKAINDVYGHVIGDDLLCGVVERSANLNLPGVTFGRIGGDEFICIISGSHTAQGIKQFGAKVIEAVSRPYPVGPMELTIGVSAGFTHYPSMATSGAQLYEQGDFALYKAKATRRGQCVLFDTAEDEEMQATIAIERQLREADLESELYLLFQPQYSPCEQRIVGFEALARWKNPTLGLVAPDQFIRAAERSGHIRKVTAILFEKALRILADWPDDISLSFNLSAHDISDHSFILKLLGKIMKSGISPSRIEFEITETAVMTDLAASRSLLEKLRASGCKIALDDFGSGYSSFEYLDQLPLDKVKIDRSFIRKVAHSTTSREIVAAVIGLCRKLDLRCVLEGVETQVEMDFLTELRPDLIQGYLYGKPMPADAVMQRIMEQDQTSTEARNALSA